MACALMLPSPCPFPILLKEEWEEWDKGPSETSHFGKKWEMGFRLAEVGQ